MNMAVYYSYYAGRRRRLRLRAQELANEPKEESKVTPQASRILTEEKTSCTNPSEKR